MSFAELVAEMNDALVEQLYEPAVYAVGGQPAVATSAAIDEPVVDAIAGYPRHALKERRIEIWLPKATVPSVVRGAVLTVASAQGERRFIVESQIHADPERIKIAAQEETVLP